MYLYDNRFLLQRKGLLTLGQLRSGEGRLKKTRTRPLRLYQVNPTYFVRFDNDPIMIFFFFFLGCVVLTHTDYYHKHWEALLSHRVDPVKYTTLSVIVFTCKSSSPVTVGTHTHVAGLWRGGCSPAGAGIGSGSSVTHTHTQAHTRKHTRGRHGHITHHLSPRGRFCHTHRDRLLLFHSLLHPCRVLAGAIVIMLYGNRCQREDPPLTAIQLYSQGVKTCSHVCLNPQSRI